MEKKRIDSLLVEKGFASDLNKARAMILAGTVIVNDQRIDKPGASFRSSDSIRIRGEHHGFASRGGEKLAKAIEQFGIDAAGRVALDIGASTGGFTDCLLQKGAARVFSLDVGYGQLAWPLRQDPRVVCMERTNIRNVSPGEFPDLFDLITIDVSFISLRQVLPVAGDLAKPGADIVALIKPQFEVEKGEVEAGGVVRDPAKHGGVVETIKSVSSGMGLDPIGVVESPLLGPMGNKEFFVHLRKKR